MNTFNAAVREAVARRQQWLRPIALWMWQDAGNVPPALGFYAAAATTPPERADDEVICTLDEDTLASLAAMLDDPEAFDGFVTDLLADAEAKHHARS